MLMRRTVAQLPQTGYHALHAPYAFLGLGRTNNYISQLFTGATTHHPEHYVALEGVVPNSRLVAIPPAVGTSNNWRTEIFLRPGAWSHWVGATVAGVLAILAAVVGGLHVAEKVRSSMLLRSKTVPLSGASRMPMSVSGGSSATKSTSMRCDIFVDGPLCTC
jgi:hypothetical protein